MGDNFTVYLLNFYDLPYTIIHFIRRNRCACSLPDSKTKSLQLFRRDYARKNLPGQQLCV